MAAECVAIVTAASGSTVKLRASASAAERLYGEVPVGTRIKVLEQQAPAGWRYCDYNGQRGYIQSQYLVSVEDMPDGPAVQANERLADIGAEIRAVLAKYGA